MVSHSKLHAKSWLRLPQPNSRSAGGEAGTHATFFFEKKMERIFFHLAICRSHSKCNEPVSAGIELARKTSWKRSGTVVRVLRRFTVISYESTSVYRKRICLHQNVAMLMRWKCTKCCKLYVERCYGGALSHAMYQILHTVHCIQRSRKLIDIRSYYWCSNIFCSIILGSYIHNISI